MIFCLFLTAYIIVLFLLLVLNFSTVGTVRRHQKHGIDNWRLRFRKKFRNILWSSVFFCMILLLSILSLPASSGSSLAIADFLLLVFYLLFPEAILILGFSIGNLLLLSSMLRHNKD